MPSSSNNNLIMQHRDSIKLYRINERAIFLLLEGYFEQAEGLFSLCLALADSLLSTIRSQKQDQSCNTNAGTRNCCFEAVKLEDVFGQEEVAASMNPPGVHFAIFEHAVSIDAGNAAATRDIGDPWSLSAMVAYNLGLFYHVQALVDGEVTQLSQARSYYVRAFSYLFEQQEHGRQYQPYCCDNGNILEATLLSMAIYNNLGHVSSLLRDGEGIIQCREAMESGLFLASTSSSTRTRITDTLAIDSFRQSLARAWGFVLNFAPAA